MSTSPDHQSPPGVVELREDVPLKSSGTAPRTCANGPRFIIAAFAALSAAITIALLTQIYYGDYEVVPHGSVSSSAAECSRSGALVLRHGGGAIDATATAALCLAILAPHRTSLDASGALVYWEYRLSQTQLPTIIEWGGPTTPAVNTTGTSIARPPRLLVALAALHARYGVLPWADVLQPAIDIARTGITIPEAPLLPDGTHAGGNSLAIADYLETFKHNTSTALCGLWRCDVTSRPGVGERAGPWRVYAGGAGGAIAARALTALGANDSIADPTKSVVSSLQVAAAGAGQAGAGAWPGGVASGLAVVDPSDTYVALVTGLSKPFGSGVPAGGAGAWTPDEPTAPLDLAPAIIVQPDVCGTRYILGAESASALAQVAAAALTGAGPVRAVEGPRAEVLPGGALLPDPDPAAPAAPAPAVNLIQQQGDALLSHADSRGGGLAERF
ncbi:glutathione hydrolase 7-like [Aricia agestis]|uniref:glutathione hydrolase 7-like n=1 Tax=Aricia agestis TaxID=91739 RepID=UPI001C20B84A|nr:glutathione hydrolase 7-like [Aricia agestis]